MKTLLTTILALTMFTQVSCQSAPCALGLHISDCIAENIEQSMDCFEQSIDQLGDSMEEFAENMEEMTDSMEDWNGSEMGNGTITINGKNIVTYYNTNKNIKIQSSKNIKISKKDKYLLRKFPVMNYKSLSVGYSFQVVMCDTVDSVIVKVNEKLKNHLKVRYNKGCREIGLIHASGVTSEDNAKCGYVYLPYNLKLNNIDMSGASVFHTNLPINTGSFELDLSGATKFYAPSIKANRIEIDLSGSSTCKTNMSAVNIEADLSGASRIEGKMTASATINIDLSGASKITSTVSASNIDCELSGASKATLNGKTKFLNLDISGASHFNGPKLTTENVNGEMSGASDADVNCSGLLVMEISGSSSLTYSGNPKTKIEKSRTASVRKM